MSLIDEELAERAEHEIAEDRRIAALMKEPRNREQLERRAQVTADLLAAVRGQGDALQRAEDAPEKVWRECIERAPHTLDADVFMDVAAWVVSAFKRSLDGPVR